MADDAIYRETKQSIDRLFAQVSGGAGSASKGLYDVGSASRSASSGLSSLTSGSENAARAAGSFVTVVGSMQSSASQFSSSLTASIAKLKEELNVTVHGITSGIDEKLAVGAAGAGMLAMHAKSLAKGLVGLPAAMLGITKSAGKASMSIKGLMSKAGGAAKAMGGFMTRHAIFAGVIGTAATVEDYVDDSYKTWKLLSTAGITLGNDLTQVGGMAGRTRLDFDELGGALAKSSSALARMGGTADHGAKTLVSMQEAMMDTTKGFKNSSESYSLSMKMMGIGPQESMDLLGSLLEDQTFAAKISGMQSVADNAKRAEITAEYIGQLDQLSKLTGKSRQALAKEMAQKAQDAQFASTLMDMDKDQAAAAKKQLLFIENTYGKDASDLFKARLAGVVPTGDGARKLMATSLGGTLSDMAQQTSQTSGIAAGNILKSFHDELGASAKETRDVLAPLARAGGLVGSSFASLFTATHTATLKNQALIEQLGRNNTGMHDLADAINNAYNKTRGVTATGPDGEILEREKFTELLKSRVSLETIADLAGTAVQAWMSGIGFGGAKSKRSMAGTALEGYQYGAELVTIGAEKSIGFNTEGPANLGGDEGIGHGLNPDSWHKMIGKLFGGDQLSGISSAGIQTRLSGSGVGGDILASSFIQSEVEASLASLGVKPDMIAQGITSTKMLAAQQMTGKTEAELQARMAGGPPGTAKTLREVVSNLQAAGPLKTDDEKNDPANVKGERLSASYIHEPITKKLDRIADILMDGSFAIPGSEVAAKEKKDKKRGADPYQAGRNAMAESMQISQV